MNIVDTFNKAIKENKQLRHPDFLDYDWVTPIVTPNGVKVLEKVDIYCKEVMIPIECADDRWEVEEEWYENFKEKYPNGVVCWVWNNNTNAKIFAVVTDYVKTHTLPFITGLESFENAETIGFGEAHAVIGDDL